MHGGARPILISGHLNRILVYGSANLRRVGSFCKVNHRPLSAALVLCRLCDPRFLQLLPRVLCSGRLCRSEASAPLHGGLRRCKRRNVEVEKSLQEGPAGRRAVHHSLLWRVSGRSGEAPRSLFSKVKFLLLEKDWSLLAWNTVGGTISTWTSCKMSVVRCKWWLNRCA